MIMAPSSVSMTARKSGRKGPSAPCFREKFAPRKRPATEPSQRPLARKNICCQPPSRPTAQLSGVGKARAIQRFKPHQPLLCKVTRVATRDSTGAADQSGRHADAHTDRTTTEVKMSEVGSIDMKLEVVTLPVSDVDRAKSFYQSLGWRLDA